MSESANSTSAKPVRPGRILGGRYKLLTRIAKGGMGEVWRARDLRSGMMVAAKVLRPELTGEEISLSRLRLEAKNTLRARHPNIAMVLDSGEDQGQGWIVMELVNGRPLTDFVGDGKRLSVEDLVPILTQTAFALDGSAQAGIVHRDIKPANILIRDDGMVKLTDFGISYSQGQANLTAVGMVMGTAQYLAPEQAMGGEATASGDLYSLGVIAYEALTGRRPFSGNSAIDIAMAHVKEDVPDLPNDIPEPVADIVFGLLEKDPAGRPPSGTALVRALTKAAKEIGVSTSPKPITSLPAEAGGDVPPTPMNPAPALLSQGVTPEAIKEPAKPLVTKAPPADVQPKLTAPTQVAAISDSDKGDSKQPSIQADEKPQLPSIPPVQPSPGHTRRWKPVSAESVDSSSVAVGISAYSAGSGGNDLGAPTPQTPVSRNSTRLPDSETDQVVESKLGMWIIISLVALTVILIIFAMVRDGGSASALANSLLSAPKDVAATCNLEVDPWFSPVLGS